MSEHRRTAAYSNDLRWRIVWQKIVDGFADKDISQNLHVSRSTVVRILDRFERTGSVNPLHQELIAYMTTMNLY